MASQYGWGPGYGLGGRKTKKKKAATTGSTSVGAGVSGLPGVTPPSGGGVGTVGPVAPPAPDPQFEAWKASQGMNLGLAQGEATYQNAQTAYQTGYNADGTANTSNPYSQAALLQETYNRSKSGTLNGYAGAGQLNSGAYGRMQNENARNYSIGSNTLKNTAADQYHQTGSGVAQAAVNYGTGGLDEGLKALLRKYGVNV